VRPSNGRSWSTSKDNFEKLVASNRIWFGKDGNNVPAVKKFLSEVKDGVSPITTWTGENLYENEEIVEFWHYSDVSHTQDAKKELIQLALDFSTPKPEKLLERIINIGSNKEDIVLDFFMGSGTTLAVAMKMNRQFIGIEQMDYIETVSVPRLQKVIEGEQGGISKKMNWQGGGSFIYAELYSLNQKFVERIQEATSDKTLTLIIRDMVESAFFDYKVNLDRLTSEGNGFKLLSLDEQKRVLIESLDANQMYLSYSEMDDDQYQVPEHVKQFNRSFYREEKTVGGES
jgi:adenine-specific DNA-methyltransferase